MKKNLVRIIPAPWAPSTPWCLIIPYLFTQTKRIKWFFPTREEAELYQARILTPPPVGGYVAAAKMRAGENQTVEDFNTMATTKCVNLWLERFVTHKQTFIQNRQLMKTFMNVFGHQMINKITVQELDQWLRSLAEKYSLTSQRNYWRRLRQFFTWARDFDYIASNPMTRLKEPVRRERAKRNILKPKHMKACLEVAKSDCALTAFLCLGGFAGVRTSEILRMNWDDLLWNENIIRVPPKVVETSETRDVWSLDDDEEEDISGKRLVTMQPALRRHLEPIALKEGAIIPGGMRKLYEQREKLRKLFSEAKWPRNCLRHSFRSYHLAAFRNLEATRIEMGHTHINTTQYIYGEPRLKPVAEAWWAL